MNDDQPRTATQETVGPRACVMSAARECVSRACVVSVCTPRAKECVIWVGSCAVAPQDPGGPLRLAGCVCRLPLRDSATVLMRDAHKTITVQSSARIN